MIPQPQMNRGLVGIAVSLRRRPIGINLKYIEKMKCVTYLILLIAFFHASVHGEGACYSFSIGQHKYILELDDETKSKTMWDGDSDMPIKVSEIAKLSRKHLSDSKVDLESFVIESIQLVTIPGMLRHWYYVVIFENIQPAVKAPPATQVVVLLLDGSIVPANKEDK